MGATIHPTAVVDGTAELADGVTLGPRVVIGPRVTVGADTEVGAGTVIQANTRIGAGNRIYPLAAVGFDPQDLTFRGEETWLEIGDRNLIREYVTLNRGTNKGGGTTRIGDDNLFMTYSHVGHDSQVGNRIVFANAATLAGHVDVEDDASISAFSAVHQFCRVGCHAYIGGYSVITKDALPFVKSVGQQPSCYGLNRVGLSRKGVDDETIRQLAKAVRILTRSGLNTSQALERLEAELAGNPRVDHFIAFVRTSKRGIIKGLPGRRSGRGGNGGANGPGAEEAHDA
jgi:UDP-N-acetylglucosamine acyltransferase